LLSYFSLLQNSTLRDIILVCRAANAILIISIIARLERALVRSGQ
jgi:hypothetical protein